MKYSGSVVVLDGLVSFSVQATEPNCTGKVSREGMWAVFQASMSGDYEVITPLLGAFFSIDHLVAVSTWSAWLSG